MSMKRTRVLIGAVPEILREILYDVLISAPGFEVVKVGNGDLPEGGNNGPPDLVVTMINDGVPETYRHLFEIYPGMRLLGLKSHGRDAFLVELQPQQVSLGELSSQDLVDAIRTAVNRPNFMSSLAEM